MELQYAIGGTIRELRQKQALTLRDVSARAFIALGFLSEIETGKKNPSPEVLESIAYALQITTTQLIKEIYEYLEEYNGQ